MSSNPSPRTDRTAALLLKGYAWLPGLVRRRGLPALTRLAGRPTVPCPSPC
jgi:hypothetical protein